MSQLTSSIIILLFLCKISPEQVARTKHVKLVIACDKVGTSYKAATIITTAFDDLYERGEFPITDSNKIFTERIRS